MTHHGHSGVPSGLSSSSFSIASSADCPCCEETAAAPKGEAANPGVLLSQVNIGSTVLVTGILGGRKEARDLGDLGIRLGHQLTILRRLLGGGVAVRYSTMTIAVGASLARQVMVKAACPVSVSP